MAADIFNFKPAEVPRALKGSKYAATVQAVHEYMQEHTDQKSVKVELGDVSVKSAVASFRIAIKKQFPDTLRLVQRRGELYIERR
jgi:hypothetical protein